MISPSNMTPEVCDKEIRKSRAVIKRIEEARSVQSTEWDKMIERECERIHEWEEKKRKLMQPEGQ